MCKHNTSRQACEKCIRITAKEERSQKRQEIIRKQVSEQKLLSEEKTQKRRDDAAEKFLNGFYTMTAGPSAMKNQNHLPDFSTVALPSVKTPARTVAPVGAPQVSSQAFRFTHRDKQRNGNVTYVQGMNGCRLKVVNGELGPFQKLEMQAVQQAAKEVERKIQREKEEQDRMERRNQ
ncbi:hypothetical protein HBH98_229270 [Parastagonospora nodorum]|nr:hypothetical protein HBH47_216400 [Parastagonospora nodorum]KAH4199738.1 hypothetical protein HBH42_035020 [Parastagonospora nodorum]KAH4274441.1 hypothetical protein HBI03_005800 [Parastagonospora nodorum]KAH4279953.1 hypothetical protein HBI04_070100 [Parastagonospora nodorum]KAH4290614.1 hypothetical protein HBI01_199380 [Parastagonospora nodorum]